MISQFFTVVFFSQGNVFTRIWCILALKSDFWWQTFFVIFRSINHTQSVKWHHFQWPWIGCWLGFQGRYIFSILNIWEMTRDRAVVTNFYRMSIGSHMRSIEWWHFQWPSRILNQVFKVMAFFEVKCRKNSASYRHRCYSTVIWNLTYNVWWP